MIFSKKNQTPSKRSGNKTSHTGEMDRKYVDGTAVMTSHPLTAQPTGSKKMKKTAMPNLNASSIKKPSIGFNASRFGTPTSTAPSSDTRKLTVGKDISLSGEIGACDHLVVEGTVEATIKGGQSLEISETGLFKGTVEIDDAIIAGRFEGNLVVKGHLLIRATGSVSGDVHYGELAIESGATLNGTIDCVGLPKKAQTEAEKRVGTMKPVFKTSVANEDDSMLHEEVTLSAPITASML